MLDYLNSLACAVLFGYCFVVAVMLPQWGMWLNKIGMWLVSGFLMGEVISPWTDWIEATATHSVFLHACLAFALVMWRREAMCFIHARFAAPFEAQKRRLSDLIELGDRARHASGGKGG